jgi:WhiB family redox-sensing transcriptional regulator
MVRSEVPIPELSGIALQFSPPRADVKAGEAQLHGSRHRHRIGGDEGATPMPTTTPAGSQSGLPAHDPDSVTAWMADGNCRMYPPATFFPSDGAGVDKARRICATCAVTDQCLEFALEHRIEHGVWGGCSERERRRILKRRRLSLVVDS